MLFVDVAIVIVIIVVCLLFVVCCLLIIVYLFGCWLIGVVGWLLVFFLLFVDRDDCLFVLFVCWLLGCSSLVCCY